MVIADLPPIAGPDVEYALIAPILIITAAAAMNPGGGMRDCRCEVKLYCSLVIWRASAPSRTPDRGH